MEIMERRGGCCIAMCGVSRGVARGDATEVASRMGRIMLRYRPIAPKPVAAGASPAVGVASETAHRRRAKRRNSGGLGGRGRKAKKLEDHGHKAATTAAAPEEKEEDVVKSSSPSSSSSTISLSSPTASAASPPSTSAASTAATLLPLMPEAPEGKPDNREGRLKPSAPETMDHTARLPPTPSQYAPPPWFCKGASAAEAVARPRPVRPAGSWVTVECLTDAWRDGEVVAPNDEALRRALETDPCPGFVTDHRDRVTWISEAYRHMVTGLPTSSSDDDDEQVTVGLVTRGMVPEASACRAFTCRVRVRYASRRRGKGSLAAPCDVWRLADGCCAWRLDIKAALSLGI